MANPTGATLHRIAAYFTESLALWAVKLWPHIFSINPPKEILEASDDDDDATALRFLDQATPIPKFIHFTLNEKLMKAFEDKDKVHVIDLDIKQGLQWASLLQSLASRKKPPSHVRISGIGGSKSELHSTGARLASLADSLNLPFQFHPVVDQLEDVRLWMLHVKEEECVAVNCVLQLHKTLYDETGGVLRDLLGVIWSTSPAIVVIAEEEADHNNPHWEVRFVNSIKYYSAVFDALNASLPEDSLLRAKIEKMFARKIRNIVACNGAERTERHQKFTKWSRMMQDGRFHNKRMGDRERILSQVVLKMYSDVGYSVKTEGEGEALCLKYQQQPLYTISAWAPMDAAGSSIEPLQADC
ncbi:hypothetical protein HPP92_004953 [Vanilla planifolia]|uniref:Scarecrow-like protein 28 n=1 Tax=Vanilla planifolia TaxID=51239 RepID=A0A835RFW9_VANPL|nr:hypothetical protein HPP92_004953 [Vanilla planifolia]